MQWIHHVQFTTMNDCDVEAATVVKLYIHHDAVHSEKMYCTSDTRSSFLCNNDQNYAYAH